jgi:hypothetical protein
MSAKIASKSIPEASEILVDEEELVTMETLMASLKTLEKDELFKLMKAVVAETEKKSKSSGKAAASKEKKKGSMPKGEVPKQLRKPRAWVEFVLANALENGWEEFVVNQKKKNKETGLFDIEEILMPGSELNEDGAYVYEGSITEKTAKGRQIIQKEAMSLSKQRWAPKTKSGSHQDLYEAFEAQYVEEETDSDNESEATESTTVTVVRKTAAEKEAEKEAKKAEKEAEKEAKKAAKEVEREAKKAEKEAEKEAKKAEKDALKKPKAVVVSKAPIPAAAAKTALAVKKTAASAAAEPVAVAKPVAKPLSVKPKAAVKKEDWTCPDDGQLYPWTFGGMKYLRNASNEVYEADEDGGLGSWAGVFDATTNKIDDSVPEPEYDE